MEVLNEISQWAAIVFLFCWVALLLYEPPNS